MEEFIIPIIKATKGNEQHVFYTLPEYESWANPNNPKGFKIKYYKGLGSRLVLRTKIISLILPGTKSYSDMRMRRIVRHYN